ncbi:predicted protein [Streptomyces lividans TK24]|uniref:Uncharacterized protein n=1 Tax=Streptomyces lividans 1326 TaxID=1200984 RepID=A0A7U9DSQ4_STRLI|nr:predicted protein [Streptomyces lividans TK24]EOY47031.1 hypothetical protein SLI_2316 [Streptomyces lividans 1326]
MLGLVLVRVPVPPAAVGAGTLRDPGGTPGGLGLGCFDSLLDDRLPRTSLRALPCRPPRVSRRGIQGSVWPRETAFVPGMRRSAPGVRLRALTLPGCPRMLQVALRACAPQT